MRTTLLTKISAVGVFIGAVSAAHAWAGTYTASPSPSISGNVATFSASGDIWATVGGEKYRAALYIDNVLYWETAPKFLTLPGWPGLSFNWSIPVTLSSGSHSYKWEFGFLTAYPYNASAWSYTGTFTI